MKIKQLLEIKKENFFNGAVQADWFYDNNRRETVAASYIFHGPRYYGLSNSDNNNRGYSLTDTVTFVSDIYKKIYEDTHSSRVLMTIAGYGAGKSHLSVALASLLSGADKEARQSVLDRIKEADEEKQKELLKYTNDKHLVLVLNGINDFNLNSELLRVTTEALDMQGLDTDIFEDMSEAYNMARKFLTNFYNSMQGAYENYAIGTKFASFSGEALYEKLYANIEDEEAFAIVNKAYELNLGTSIKMSHAVSASTILNRVHQKYVIEEKKFKSIVIIFDEFGRYLEYASANPSKAGDAALQQIYEAIQNASPDILFIGFIQSELSVYISRVNNDNIMRYVGRYQNGDKYYLSSNLETVVANVIKKNDRAEEIIEGIYNSNLANLSEKLYTSIIRWQPEFDNKSVWAQKSMFKRVILTGCYPLHPMTVALMVSLTSYMQQRSTISFLYDKFEQIKDQDIDSRFMPYIYPVDFLNSPIFNEILNAEEKGRISGQDASIYNEIRDKYEELLTSNDSKVLCAILIMAMIKYKTYDQNDAQDIIKSLTGLYEDEVKESLQRLESEVGIIGFNSELKRYEFTSSGASRMDFVRLLNKKQLGTNNKEVLDVLPKEIVDTLKLDSMIPVAFGRQRGITTQEWAYRKSLVDVKDITDAYLINITNELNKRTDADVEKCRVIYLYVTQDTYGNLNAIQQAVATYDIDNTNLILGVINDTDGLIEKALYKLRALSNFNEDEKNKFKSYYEKEYRTQVMQVTRTFSQLSMKKQFINAEGMYIADGRVDSVVDKRFEELYPKVLPFAVDGFEKKIGAKARKNYNSIIEAMWKGNIDNSVEYNNLPIELKNRIEAIFSVEKDKSWKIFYDKRTLGTPMLVQAKEIYEEIDKEFRSKKVIGLNSWISKLTSKPYGMNTHAAVLFIMYFIYQYKGNVRIFKNNAEIKVANLLELFTDDKQDKFNEFKKLQISYTEENQSQKYEKMLERYNRVLNLSIDEVMKVDQEFAYVDEAEVDVSLRGSFSASEMMLNTIRSKNQEIETILAEAEQKVEKISKNPTLIKTILNDLKDIKEGKIAGFSCSYSLNQVQKAADLREQCMKKIPLTLVVLAKSPLKNKQQVTSTFTSLKNYFKDSGHDDICELIDTKQKEYSQRYERAIKAKKELESMDGEINRITDEVRRGETLEEVIKVADEKIQFLNQRTDLQEQGKEYLTRLDKIKNDAQAILDKSNSIKEKLETDLLNCTSIEEVSEILRFIASNLGTSTILTPKVKDYLVLNNTTLTDIRSIFEKVQDRLLLRTELEEKTREAMRLCHGNGNYQMLIVNLINECKAYNEEQENKWRENYIYAYRDIEALSIAQLRGWEIKARHNLEYFSEETKNMFETKFIEINNRINELSLENIESIFDGLNYEQKIRCLELLRSKLG